MPTGRVCSAPCLVAWWPWRSCSLGSEHQTRSHGTLVLAWVDTHRGKMVEVLSWRVLARHRWWVPDLLPLIEAVVHGVSHGGTVLVLVHGTGRAQRPRQRLSVQPFSRSLRGTQEMLGRALRTAHHHHHPSPASELPLQKGWSPSTREGFFPHPHLFVLFQQLLQLLLLLLLPLAVILGGPQLGQSGLVQSPPCQLLVCGAGDAAVSHGNACTGTPPASLSDSQEGAGGREE